MLSGAGVSAAQPEITFIRDAEDLHLRVYTRPACQVPCSEANERERSTSCQRISFSPYQTPAPQCRRSLSGGRGSGISHSQTTRKGKQWQKVALAVVKEDDNLYVDISDIRIHDFRNIPHAGMSVDGVDLFSYTCLGPDSDP